MTTIGPPEEVLVAFGVSSAVENIAGGQGTTWRAGEVILKPLDMLLEALHWQAELLGPLIGSEHLRLAAPRRAKNGVLLVNGWTAWDRLDGMSEHGRWDDIIDAGIKFCKLTQAVSRPSFLDSRRDPWAEADRIAWGEQSAESVVHVRFVRILLSMREDVNEPSQLVHGDLTGNVLFSPNKAPAVIDLSPYWRPPSYATAIVLADALTWEEAPLDWARGHLAKSGLRQAFIRALLFRILSDYLRSPTEPISSRYEYPIGLICELAAQRQT